MWTKETIKENLENNLLPCGRCHKWKDSKKEFGKYASGKKHKVCKECNKNWKESFAESKKVSNEMGVNKEEECTIM